MREMRDSGVEWIGEIPKDWNCCKQKYRFTLINGRAFKDNEFEEDGTYRILRVGNLFSNPVWYSSSLELEPDKYCEKGDLIYAWSMSYGPYIWNEEKVIYHYHIWKTKLVSDMDKMFSYYYLQALTESIKSQTHETTMGFVTMGIMNNSYIAYPRNIKEQKKISDYLDAKCSKIDEIIEKQLSIIEKLKEYKLSIITEAVTSGINPDVEMKDSGSVWFGNIPINWEMKRLKYVFHIQKDIAGEEGHTVLSITQRGIIPKDFSNNEGQFANSYANYQLVHKGDFAMNHMDLLTGWVDISKYEGVTSPDYRVFVLNDKNGMCPKYYLYMMQMCYSARIFYGLGQGVSGMGRWRLQADNQEKWQSYAKNNDRATFMLLFEKDFPNMAADRYEQNDQFFRKLFDDPDMMRQVMETVGSVLYERLKKKYIFDPKSGVIEEATPETYVEDTYLTKK